MVEDHFWFTVVILCLQKQDDTGLVVVARSSRRGTKIWTILVAHVHVGTDPKVGFLQNWCKIGFNRHVVFCFFIQSMDI